MSIADLICGHYVPGYGRTLGWGEHALNVLLVICGIWWPWWSWACALLIAVNISVAIDKHGGQW